MSLGTPPPLKSVVHETCSVFLGVNLSVHDRLHVFESTGFYIRLSLATQILVPGGPVPSLLRDVQRGSTPSSRECLCVNCPFVISALGLTRSSQIDPPNGPLP